MTKAENPLFPSSPDMSAAAILGEYLKEYHTGKASAITSRNLRHFGKGPFIRSLVHILRCSGVPICSSNTGYYYAETAREIEEAINFLNSYLKNIRDAKMGLSTAWENFRESGGKKVGAVKVESYNERLMNIANYEDPAQLKNLYRNFYRLRDLAGTGDSVAATLYIDLKTALECGCMTENQERCIKEHLLEKATMQELADEYGVAPSSISKSVDGGLKRLQKALTNGYLYERGQT